MSPDHRDAIAYDRMLRAAEELRRQLKNNEPWPMATLEFFMAVDGIKHEFGTVDSRIAEREAK